MVEKTTGAAPPTATLVALITAWRLAPDEEVTCPVCSQSGFMIEDRSTRPYAEWYQCDCPQCGFTQTLNIPLGGPTGGA